MGHLDQLACEIRFWSDYTLTYVAKTYSSRVDDRWQAQQDSKEGESKPCQSEYSMKLLHFDWLEGGNN